MEGVPTQPRRKSRRSSSSRHSQSHCHLPYEGNKRTHDASRSSVEGRGKVLGELTNSPKKDRIEILNSLKDGKGRLESPNRKGQESPSGADWFMAPRKGGIGKA
jgi:hypothetical protein